MTTQEQIEALKAQIMSIVQGNQNTAASQLNSQNGLFNTSVDNADNASELLASNGDPILASFMKMKGTSGGDPDALMNVWQQYLQYQLGEQNYQRNKAESELAYQRGLPTNQVNQLMRAGMSRSAALSAVQGVQYQPAASGTEISPQPTNIEANRVNKMNAIMNVVQGAAQLAQQIAGLASAPFDIKSKQITNDLLANQNNMLEMQIQGMQDAAMFTQAVANADISRGDDQKIANLPINDQYAYFADMQGKAFDFAKHSASSWQYAQSQPFSRSSGNPFFWATLYEQTRSKNFANASVFEPLKAQQEISHLRAGTEYVQAQAKSEQFRSRILGVQSFHDEYLADSQRELDLLRNECQRNQISFDNERAKAFLSRVREFTDYDFAVLDYQMRRILQIGDPAIMEKERSELVASLDYNVANYIYAKGIVSSKNGALQQFLVNPDQPLPDGSTFTDWLTSYLQFNEFGNITQLNYELNKNNSVWRNIFGGCAAAFAGYKIFGAGAKVAAGAAGAVGSAGAAGAAGVGILGLPLLFRGDSSPASLYYQTDPLTGTIQPKF